MSSRDGEPGIPVQVVMPSVSRAVVLQGAAFTTFVELPSGPTSSGLVPDTHPAQGRRTACRFCQVRRPDVTLRCVGLRYRGRP